MCPSPLNNGLPTPEVQELIRQATKSLMKRFISNVAADAPNGLAGKPFSTETLAGTPKIQTPAGGSAADPSACPDYFVLKNAWEPAMEAVKSLKIEHVEKRTFSYILGRTVIGCEYCRALKGSREWEYDCRGADNGKTKSTDA